MNEVIFTEEDFSSLGTQLRRSKFESCAILLTSPIRQEKGSRLLVRDIHMAPPDAYRRRNTSRAVLDPAFLAPLAKRALKLRSGLAFVHTHPWEKGTPNFSLTDDQGEQLLTAFLKHRKLLGPHVALLFGQNSCRARLLGTHREVRVITLGKSRAIVFEPSILKTLHRYHDRQVRLLGVHGQDVISRLRVGIVGLGGTGSVVAQELAYLGIRNFLLIDPDTVDKTNLNRLVGAYRKHIDRPKVRVASEHIRQINPEATVSALSQSVLDADTARSLLATDFIFCCTDSQASRAVLNQLAYQYLIPTIDSGVSITTGGQKVDRIAGRIQLLSPGQACLTCQELLNANVVREEFMTPEQRAQDPYFVGVGEPQPAVVSLNGTISSLAVTMFLAVVTDLPSSARYLLYDALQGKVRPATASQYPTCIVCSKHGSLARGDQWSLPVRQVSTHEPVK